MDRITHARRLQQFFHGMVELGQTDQLVSESNMLIAASLKSPAFKDAGYAERHCLGETERAHCTCPRLDEAT